MNTKVLNIVKTVVVSIGMLTDAYEVFLMNLISIILAVEYPKTSYASWLNVTILIGMALGQLLFGYLGDRIGRKPMFIITGIILIVFSFASGLIFPIIFEEPYISLSIIRFLLGLGIGGEYPLSSTITAETSKGSSRGRNMVFIFTMRGIGNLFAPIVVYILLITGIDLDYVWRIAFMLGALPCLLTLVFRFLLDFPGKVRKPEQKIKTFEIVKKNILPLIGTAGTWFLFDVAFYGNSMCNANVLKIIGFASDNGVNSRSSIQKNSVGNIILTAISLPGFLVAYLIINKVSKRYTQMVGFFGTAVSYLLLAFLGKTIIEHCPYVYVIIYGISFFFQNMGPNTMRYVLSTEVYETSVRSTCSGISAASGKLGGIIGTLIFDPITEEIGVEWIFIVCAVLMIIGLFLTFFIPKKHAFEESDNYNEMGFELVPTDDVQSIELKMEGGNSGNGSSDKDNNTNAVDNENATDNDVINELQMKNNQDNDAIITA